VRFHNTYLRAGFAPGDSKQRQINKLELAIKEIIGPED
jgi:hypothetical protein